MKTPSKACCNPFAWYAHHLLTPFDPWQKYVPKAFWYYLFYTTFSFLTSKATNKLAHIQQNSRSYHLNTLARTNVMRAFYSQNVKYTTVAELTFLALCDPIPKPAIFNKGKNKCSICAVRKNKAFSQDF